MAESVFYDIADTPEEATNLTARGLLMIAIEQRIRENGWTQAEAAQALGVRQPRVSDLMNGKVDKFSLDSLVNMLPAVGLTLSVGAAQQPKRRGARRLVGVELPPRVRKPIPTTRKVPRPAAAVSVRKQPSAAKSKT